MIVSERLRKLSQLNLFVDARTNNEQDGQVLCDQVLSTRIYLVSLTTSILTLALFIFFANVTVQVMVNNSSFDTYKYLEAAFQTHSPVPVVIYLYRTPTSFPLKPHITK